MIGAVVFVIVFVLFTLISLVIDIPPGIWAHDLFNVPTSEYSSIINGVVNGVVYGVIIWIVYSLARLGRKKEPVKPTLPEKAFVVGEPRESKIPIELTQIQGIGDRRAEQLRTAGVKTVSDLAKRSAKNLSEKTGIPIKIISKWIVQANEMIQ